MERLHISSKTLLQYKNDQIDILGKLLKKASKHPTPKRIHQLRITIRRLGVVQNSPKLKKLAKVLGKERDLDVAIKNAKHYQLGTRKLKQAQKKASKKSVNAIKAFSLPRSANVQLLIKYKRMMRNLNLELEKFDLKKIDQEELHRLRIVFKKIRYGLEAIGQFYLKLQTIQTLLGQIHDLEALQKLVGKNKKIKQDKEAATAEVIHINRPVIRLTKKALDRI